MVIRSDCLTRVPATVQGHFRTWNETEQHQGVEPRMTYTSSDVKTEELIAFFRELADSLEREGETSIQTIDHWVSINSSEPVEFSLDFSFLTSNRKLVDPLMLEIGDSDE